MNIKNILFYFSFMVITTIIYKHYTNLFMNEINTQNINSNIHILFLGFLTSKLADIIININI